MGGAFLGSQKQPFKKTVFNTIESVFYTIFKQTIVCIPCGRTDTGVNASYMVFHADFSFLFNHDHLKQRLNNHLINDGIIIRSIDLVSDSFHALSSAISRSYRYFFTFDDSLPNYLLHSVSLLNQKPLFIPTSNDLLFLKGRRNFKFLSNKSANKSLIREIYSVSLTTQLVEDLFGNSCDIYCFEIVANGFLYRMVRHIVGLLLHSMVNFTNMDYLKDYIIVHRGLSYCLAPAKGLHLIDVKY
ncbi:MAG: hypothetical protein VXX85_07160 [Candidatus Margulisiibacteriota bacterium]|nr:hypothetical protein [Candidatus Margulisiibacteriota bacterium]